MICNNCNRLAFVQVFKACVSCSKDTGCKLKVLCDSCSDNKNQCQVCLKNTSLQPLTTKSSCNSCGGKK